MDFDASTLYKIGYFACLAFICLGICGMIALGIPHLNMSNSTAVNTSLQGSNIPEGPAVDRNATTEPTAKTLDENLTDEDNTSDATDLPADDMLGATEEMPVDELPILDEVTENETEENPEDDMLVPIENVSYPEIKATDTEEAATKAATPKTSCGITKAVQKKPAEEKESTAYIKMKKIVNKSGYAFVGPDYAGKEVEITIPK